MTKLYRKSEITFAILWIVAYVVLTSLAEALSESLGSPKSVTAAVHLTLALVLFFWIRRNGLSEKYGFCRPKFSAKRFLFYLPLAVIASASLWNGVALRYGLVGTLLYVISMCCVGFLEEVIFRGLLFRAMEKDNVKRAIIISALTFGLGHIVNLFNGSGRSLPQTLFQIGFAIMVGFVLVLIFYRGGSLIPCIVFHAVNNSLGAFEAQGTLDLRVNMALNAAVTILVLGGYLVYLVKAFPKLSGQADTAGKENT